MPKEKGKPWYVYLVQCSDGTLYCGSCVDLTRRVREHNETNRGAKYTRSRRPVKLVYWESYPNMSMAFRQEANIKKLPTLEKRRLAKFGVRGYNTLAVWKLTK